PVAGRNDDADPVHHAGRIRRQQERGVKAPVRRRILKISSLMSSRRRLPQSPLRERRAQVAFEESQSLAPPQAASEGALELHEILDAPARAQARAAPHPFEVQQKKRLYRRAAHRQNIRVLEIVMVDVLLVQGAE